MAAGARRRRQPRRIQLALFGVVVIVIGCYLVFNPRIPFIKGYELKATFQSSNQLVPGFSPVRIAGVNVGKVTGVEDGPGNSTNVTMEIRDSALPVHADAKVRIRPRLFLEGGFAVELNPGSPSAPELDSGDTLPQSQTSIPVQFHQILSAFDNNTRADFQDFVRELDTGLGDGGARALGQSFKPLSPLLRDVALVARAGRGPGPHDPSEGIRAGAVVTAKLAEREADLRGLLGSLNQTMTALAERDVELADSVREFNLIVREAPPQLDRINATLPTLSRFAQEIRPSLKVLPPVLDHTVPVLDQLRAVARPAELPGLVDDLQPALNELEPLIGRLNRLFPLVTPVSDCVRDRVVPVLNQVVPDGDLSTGRPAWQDLAHSFVGLASAAQNFDANGFSVRYQAGVGDVSIGTGSVPGLGTLTGLSTEEIAGSRPRWLGPNEVPPLVASEPCRDQDPVDLTQRTEGGGPLPARSVDVTKPETDAEGLRGMFRQFEQGLEELGP